MSFNSVMKHSPLMKSKLVKEPTDDYSRRSDDAKIIEAVKEDNEFSFGEVMELEYIGTDWEMGSQYYAVMFKGNDEAHWNYYVSLVIDWSGNRNDTRGAMVLDTHYFYELDEAKAKYNEIISEKSRGTRKGIRKSNRISKASLLVTTLTEIHVPDSIKIAGETQYANEDDEGNISYDTYVVDSDAYVVIDVIDNGNGMVIVRLTVDDDIKEELRVYPNEADIADALGKLSANVGTYLF